MKRFGGLLTIAAFTALYIFERRKPLRPQVELKKINTGRNLAIAATAGAAATIFEKPVTDCLTAFVEDKRFGLLKIFRLPELLETVSAVLLLDYTLYLWHVLAHKNAFLWRFHRVHHADLDLTTTTAIRFHFGEIIVSVLWRAAQILSIGVSPKALETWQRLLFLSILFHHSNWRLPGRLEDKLNRLIMTPRLHGIHHSVKETEMNSNWSSGLTAWDILHGTFQDDTGQSRIKIGVSGFDSPADVGLIKMLAAPFRLNEDAV